MQDNLLNSLSLAIIFSTYQNFWRPDKQKLNVHILIFIPWNVPDEKCDIIYHYTGQQVEWLRLNNYL